MKQLKKISILILMFLVLIAPLNIYAMDETIPSETATETSDNSIEETVNKDIDEDVYLQDNFDQLTDDENLEETTDELQSSLVQSNALSSMMLTASAVNTIATTSNSYYDQMSSTDKAKIGTFANYTLNGNVVYSFLYNQTDSSGKTYELSINGSTATDANYYNLCTSPITTGTWYSAANKQKYTRNSLYNCVYYGYPYNKYSTDLLDKAINTYGIPKAKAQDALRLATQLAIWYTTNINSTTINYGWHTSKSNSVDPVFYLAGDIAYQAYENSKSRSSEVTLDVYSVSGNAPYLLATRTTEMTPLTDDSSESSSSGSETVSPEGTFKITGTVTVNGNKPGADNIFTFVLYGPDGTTQLTKVQNDADGNIVFDASSYAYTSFIVRQEPTDAELQSHTNFIFDGSVRNVTVEGLVSSEGAYWIVDGGKYSTDGGTKSSSNKNNVPITVYQNQDRTGKSIYAYCIENKKSFPYAAPSPVSNSLYTAHIVTSDTDIQNYSEKSMTASDIATLKKIIYYYTINQPKTMEEWEKVEDAVGYETGNDISISTNIRTVLNTISSVTVPSGFVFVILTSDYSDRLQNIMTGYMKDTRKVASAVSFANVTSTPGTHETEDSAPTSVTATIKAHKILDGVKSQRQFTFGLYDEDEKLVGETVKNDTNGEVIFNVTYTEAGTYTYTIKEIADANDISITYDTNSYPVTVVVDGNDLANLSATTYYSYDSGINGYYVSKDKNTAEIKTYCLDSTLDRPDDPTNEQVTYTKIENPTSEVLKNYVHYDRYGDDLAENIRKMVYYLDSQANVYDYRKSALMWAMTDNLYEEDYQNNLDLIQKILNIKVPEDYKIVLFVPSNAEYQALIGGYGTVTTYIDDTSSSSFTDPVLTEPTFENFTKQNVVVNLKGNKYLDNHLYTGNYQFSFSLYEADSSWNITDNTALMTINNNGSSISFNNVMTVTEADIDKTYYFVTKENADSSYNIDADVKKYKVYVQLNNGVLEAVVTVDGTTGDTADFYNTRKIIVPTGINEGSPIIYESLFAGVVIIVLLMLKRLKRA